jgi:hypothetical protein
MNWENVDLKSPYESSQNILDGYSFDILLLEIACNLPVISRETVTAQFRKSIHAKIESAKEIFENNLDNILKEALEYRNKP